MIGIVLIGNFCFGLQCVIHVLRGKNVFSDNFFLDYTKWKNKVSSIQIYCALYRSVTNSGDKYLWRVFCNNHFKEIQT